MSSPLVETCSNLDMSNDYSAENADTGFPFDTSDRGEDRFQSQLDDIAKRHPEFAETLNLGNFQNWGRPRGTSTSHFRESPRANRSHYADHFFERPFGSRLGFNDNFPFDDDPEEIFERRRREEAPVYNYTDTPVQEEKSQAPSQTPNKPPPATASPRKPKANPLIQQSNTVDLGQKQEPVDDNRNQRSMSAPPENRTGTGRRFISSINIPNLNVNVGPSGDMGSSQSQNPPPPAQSRSNERIIPIHIEGQDEPVIPKNSNSTFASAPPPPQPETIFGQRSTNFTQFLNKNEQESAQRQHDEMVRQQMMKQQQEYERQQQENFQKQQQEQFQQQQQQHDEQQPQQPQRFKKPTPLDLIQNIQKDVLELMGQVEKFDGKPKDKKYLYLDEMLTRNLLKLDDIETEGKDVIRQARKEAIKCIEGCIRILESKAVANEKAGQGDSMELGKENSQDSEPMEKKDENVPMEVETTETKPKAAETTAPVEVTEELKKKKTNVEEEKEKEEVKLENIAAQDVKSDNNKQEADTQLPEESETNATSQTSEAMKEKTKVKKK